MDKHDAQFTNFKIHSQYSICEGAVKIDELADYCKEKKIKAIGLCDSLNLCGALEFSEKISKVGTQPIIGTNINFKQNEILGKLPLFAKTKMGYRNLTKLSSKSYLDNDGTTDPFCEIQSLYDNHEDLIVLSGGIHNFWKSFKLNKLKLIQEIILNFKNF